MYICLSVCLSINTLLYTAGHLGSCDQGVKNNRFHDSLLNLWFFCKCHLSSLLVLLILWFS